MLTHESPARAAAAEAVQDGAQARRLRIDLTNDFDVAYWCRLLGVDATSLRRAVQQVGPQAGAVSGWLQGSRRIAE